MPYRPYPAPRGPWIMRQTWHDLLFVHWPVPVEVLQPLVPAVLPLDTFDGSAWLGVVPFRMSGVRPRFVPAVPWLSAFPELNVRTYVTRGGRPGVFFFSLDADNPVAVALARALFHLPYFRASMRSALDPGGIAYQSRRTHHGAPRAAFQARYRPTGPVQVAPPGSLAYFLTARYCLYTEVASNPPQVTRARDGQGRVLRIEIDHLPWPLQPAEAVIAVNTMVAAQGITLPAIPPLLYFSRRLDVVVWPPVVDSGQ